MWRGVDNSLTPLSLALNGRSSSVENDCGQMCTNTTRVTGNRDRVAHAFCSKKGRDLARFAAKNGGRNTRRRVTSLYGPRGRARVEKAKAVHTPVWTGC